MKINKKFLVFFKSTFLLLILLLVHQNIFATNADLTIIDDKGDTVLDLALKRLATTEDEAKTQNIPYLTVEKGQPNLVSIIKILFDKDAPFGNTAKSKDAVQKYLAVEGNEGRLKGWLGDKYQTLLTKVGITVAAARTAVPEEPVAVSGPTTESYQKNIKKYLETDTQSAMKALLGSLMKNKTIKDNDIKKDKIKTFNKNWKNFKYNEIITKLNSLISNIFLTDIDMKNIKKYLETDTQSAMKALLSSLIKNETIKNNDTKKNTIKTFNKNWQTFKYNEIITKLNNLISNLNI